MKNIIILITCLMTILSCKKDELKWNLIKTPEISDITLVYNSLNNFEVSATCLSDGNDEISEIGFCWSTNENPTIENNVIINSNISIGEFTSKIDWTGDTILHIRAFVKNSLDVTYSNNFTIYWGVSYSNLPTVETITVSNLSFYSLRAHAKVLSTGGLVIISKGICISTSPNPNLNNATQIQYFNDETNPYFVDFTDLLENTNYYITAFATNLAGTSYGLDIPVRTSKIYDVGDIGPSGGYIIYKNPNNLNSTWNYLEVAPADLIEEFPWAPNDSLTNITNIEINSGFQNTISIINRFGSSQNYAAIGAKNLINGSDWFLPSLKELQLVKELLFDQGIGNFTNQGIYWSSSEDENYSQNAWSVKMTSNQQNQITTQTKNLNLRVRAIRRI